MIPYAVPEKENLSLKWVLTDPPHPSKNRCLVILCGNWVYGLVPYCGPGRSSALWMTESAFLGEISQYLVDHGFWTLHLAASDPGCGQPDDSVLADMTGSSGVLQALRDNESLHSWKPKDMIFFGHGLGTTVICQLASLGIRPKGSIFAGGVYSDLEVILSQKYLPLVQMLSEYDHPEEETICDPESVLIARNLGIILQAARRGSKSLFIQDEFHSLRIRIHPELFNGDQMPRSLFRYVTSPSLILHGSSDIDVTLWNAVSIEQALRQTIVAPKREILTDRDHWFRPVPQKRDHQYRERFSGECFSYKTDERFFKKVLAFIQSVNKRQNV